MVYRVLKSRILGVCPVLSRNVSSSLADRAVVYSFVRGWKSREGEREEEEGETEEEEAAICALGVALSSLSVSDLVSVFVSVFFCCCCPFCPFFFSGSFFALARTRA